MKCSRCGRACQPWELFSDDGVCFYCISFYCISEKRDISTWPVVAKHESPHSDPCIATMIHKAVLERVIRFLGGLNLQHHSVAEQRERSEVLRKLMKAMDAKKADR